MFSLKTLAFIITALFINAAGIRLEGFKPEYARHDIIEYSIINDTGEPQLVQISIDTKVTGEWEEVIEDATDIYSFKSKSYSIEKGEKKFFSHRIGFGNGFFAEHDKLPIRFKVTYMNKTDTLRKVLYSNLILVNK